MLFFPGRQSAARLGDDFHRAYFRSAIVLSGLWLLCKQRISDSKFTITDDSFLPDPVCWGLADGGNVISPNAEMIFVSGQYLPTRSYVALNRFPLVRSPRRSRQAGVLLL